MGKLENETLKICAECLNNPKELKREIRKEKQVQKEREKREREKWEKHWEEVSQIKVGDSIRCLNCEKEFEVTKIKATPTGELIECPKCNSKFDVQDYLIEVWSNMGKKRKKKSLNKHLRKKRKQKERENGSKRD